MTSVGVVNMEEREALKRQIELLQNLINKHKSIHGDAPFPGNEPPQPFTSGRGRGLSAGRPRGSGGASSAACQGRGSWRKTYSLKNKPPSSTAAAAAAAPPSVTHSTSLPSCSTAGAAAAAAATATASSSGAAKTSAVPERNQTHLQHKQPHELQRAENQRQAPAVLQASSSTSSTTHAAAGAAPADVAAARTKTSQMQGGEPFLTKSKFTWVKSRNPAGAEPRLAASSGSIAAKASPKLGVPAGSAAASASAGRKTPAKRSLRKLSPLNAAPKTSKYKWVSSAGAQAKPPRKPPSPRTLSAKLKTAAAASPKLKKGAAGGASGGAAAGSRYRWKAGMPSASAAVVAGGAVAARRKSAFHWTAERSSRGAKGGPHGSPTLPQRASFPSSSPGAFKLRSRMKIIRKMASSGGASEKGGAVSAARFSPRARFHTSTRSPVGARKTPGRELVSFGKHKLRRLSPNVSRTSPASPLSHHLSPASSQRVFRSRYKLVTRPGSGAAHALHHYNPALSWRAKRIQSARSFLQSRLRGPAPAPGPGPGPAHRHQPPAARWRGSSMCWIRGSLYRVSANKLSRTTTASLSINRTGRSSGFQTSPLSPRPSSTRHLASRAVQRSLAIIRLARQKKQPKQFCMYYNRFGRCNRGAGCPYIHDPDKVAVCTRFLRGTCKQADTCPFSHKVAKEKMPVCSYFLKGVCNNSECPYSHVYVSRKAKVCEDFVKGYCPEGQKCKKKHTLVCPDFSQSGSCPRGSRCKLLHRQRLKRGGGGGGAPAKRARRDPVKRPGPSLTIPPEPPAAPGTPRRSALALPSFISLCSSPEEADAPDAPPADAPHVKEKKLQIKPRL